MRARMADVDAPDPLAASTPPWLDVRLYARQGGKQRAIRDFLGSLPEAERRNVRAITRSEAEEAQRRRREEVPPEMGELDAR
jgi:hypothetical protein